MKIRTTAKVLNVSKIKPISDETPTIQSMPGEWYAGVLSLLPARIEKLLKRAGYESLIPQYQIDTTPEIYKTNNKSMLGYLNQIKLEIECLLTYRYPPGEIAGYTHTKPKKIRFPY